MKFLHLADLHIGKSVNGFSMLDEQRHIFAQILTYIKEHKPQAIIIAGDVYDRAVPGTEAVALFDDFLTGLGQEGIAVLLIAGNHDSPERLAYGSRLLADKGLHLKGVLGKKPPKITLTDEYGDVHFWLLPFIKPATVRPLFENREIESYSQAFSAVLEAADIDYSARNVLVAHQFFFWPGIEPIRSESELNPIGGLDAIDAHLIQAFDYAALGHLHRAQSVGKDNIRYGGSPLKYSFSEWQQEKSVTLAELKEKGSLRLSTLPLIPIRDLRQLKGSLEGVLQAPGNREDYLRIILTDEEEIIDPLGKLRSVYPNVMVLDFSHRPDNVEPAAAEKLQQLSPYDLFGEFFLETTGSALSPEQAKIVRELLERAAEE